MNFISRIFTKTTVDPLFQHFIDTYNNSIRRSNIVLSLIIAVCLITLVVIFFISSPNINTWLIGVSLFSFLFISFIVSIILQLKVKDHVLENLALCYIYNKESFTDLKQHLALNGYITIEQLDRFIHCELSYLKILHTEDKKGSKALLAK